MAREIGKTPRISVRCTQEGRRIVKMAALQRGDTVEDYVIRAIDRELFKEGHLKTRESIR